MSFSRTLPFPTRLWRRLTSHRARLFYLGFLLIVIVPAIALRVEAALFERRVLKLMSALSSLRIGATAKPEALSRLAGFKVEQSSRGDLEGNPHALSCESEECLSIDVSSPSLCLWVLRRAGSTSSDRLFSGLSWLGFRCGNVNAYVNLTSSKVSSLAYHLILSTAHADIPGAILINVTSGKSLTGRELDHIADESPNYQVSHYFKWPALTTNIDFTPDAPTELVTHAFNLKMRCVLSATGCRTANELLPEAEQDRLRIERAAFDRMNGPNQCPDWILPRRARDTADILLVTVKMPAPTSLTVAMVRSIGPPVLLYYACSKAKRDGRSTRHGWIKKWNSGWKPHE